jgi:site-specific DNA recombinase
VWNRREWRKNPDSERRERLYRIRNEDEWIRNSVPDLRIVDDALWQAVQREFARRAQSPSDKNPSQQRRRKHLLSGLIKCATCGSNYTISGKDYYRCAGVKERATCDNRVSVRIPHIEQATMSVLQQQLLTDEHAQAFVEAFRDEAARFTREQVNNSDDLSRRLRMIETELSNLEQNMLSGLISPTLQRLLSDREAEKARLQAQLATKPSASPAPEILPHRILIARFKEKVGDLCLALNDERIRGEAAQVIGQLIERVSIYPEGPNGPEAEVSARVDKLMGYAAYKNSPLGAIPEDCSVMLVAGVGFEPTTFRL